MPKSNRIDWDDSATAGQNARLKLPSLVQSFFRTGRKVADPSSSEAALHQFRLRAKRLRYTLEFFRFYYGPGLERRLAVLREIQGCLGEISDCAVTRELTARTLAPRSAERQQADRFLRGRARRKAAQFRRYWREVVDVPGEERRWRNYLSRVAAERG
jgi:CHAD domain-containing protein